VTLRFCRVVAHIQPCPPLLRGQGQAGGWQCGDVPRKWKVAKEMIGRRLSQEEAKRLLA